MAFTLMSTDKTVYEDTGCDLHPSCLSCPRPLCKYDEPAVRHSERDVAIRLLAESGKPARVIARDMGISVRTVHRVKGAGIAS